MFEEQIEKEVQRQMKDVLGGEYNLLSLPLIADYKILEWDGAANGTALAWSDGIGIDDVRRRIIIIKSFKLIPYYAADGKDFNFSDGVSETVYNNTRVNRLFDFINVGTNIDFIINDVPLKMFQADSYPADLFVDNVFYKYPEKLQSLEVRVNMRIIEDLAAGAAATPNVRVVVECYLI